MSHALYNKWWIATKKQLEDLQMRDKILQQVTKPMKSRPLCNNVVGGLYSRYSLIVQDLAACLDQNCLIQKRFTMKKLVDAATIRLNELKEELVNINLSEYHYIDGNLIELKLIPNQVQILDPALVCDRSITIEDLWTKIKNGETIYTPPPPEPERSTSVETQAPETAEAAKAVTEANPGEAAGEDGAKAQETKETQGKKPKKERQPYVPPVIELSLEQMAAKIRKEAIGVAVTIVQAHERGRQARLYYSELDRRRKLRKILEYGGTIPPDAELVVQEAAAINIQKRWRGQVDRMDLKRREKDRRLLIGMTEPSWKSTGEQIKLKATIEKRREIRDQHIREYIQANLDEKERVLRVIAPGLMEDIGEEIREWFFQWYTRVRNFDQYPPEELGGSILVVRGETMTPEQWLNDVEKKKTEMAKEKGGKDAKEEEKKKAKQEAEKKKKELAKQKKEAALLKKMLKKQGFQFKFNESVAVNNFKEGFKEYKEIWDERPFEENIEQKHYMDMITEQKCYEMQLEVRLQVDELMRIELDLLNQAWENDKSKGKKAKGKGGKKGKGKGKGKKGKKDPTGDRTTEDLFQELVDNGIIHSYPEVHLSEYIGDFSYANWEKRNLEFDPPATLGDVRQAVMMNCILPLGVDSMVKPKSVLIAGHPQSGRHLLANAVFYETRCVLFDLSPPILAGKYPGKQMNMLLHLINKMARLLQPSVIYIDGGEKPFYKKVPNPEKPLEPKKMGGKLFKGIVKPIMPEDKILVLGITNQPFAAKGAMLKAFERVIFIPRTDYGSVYMIWRNLLMPHHGIDRDFNVSELATVSINYPVPAIKEAVEKVLIPSRIVQLKYRPLDAHELLDALINGPEKIEDKVWSKFEKWFSKTALAKQRRAYMKVAEEEREAAAKAAEKAKNK